MSKKRIITDDIDLSAKTAMTDESFYSDKTNKSSDSTLAPSPVYKGDSRFFALLSTSDKPINSRLYDKESWKKTVTDGTWTGPLYAKPMIRNHDIRSQIPFGRIKDSFFVEHGTNTVFHKDNKQIDKKVLDFYKNASALTEGSGSVIVEFSADENMASRMMSGLDVTVSQSSYFQDATCTICGSDYFGGDCNHMAGRTYQIKKDDVTVDVECLVMTKDFEPIELSIVNTPANDTSVIYVLQGSAAPSGDAANTEGVTNDSSKKQPGIDGNKNPCEDNGEDKTKQTEDKNKMFKEMLKDTLTANIKKDISDNAELLTAFGALFDASSEEQVPLVKTLMDEIAKVIETVKLETADNTPASTEPVTNEPTPAPAPATVPTEAPAAEPNGGTTTPEPTPAVSGDSNEPTVDPEAIKSQVKDALGVVQKETKKTNDNKIISTLVNGLKL